MSKELLLTDLGRKPCWVAGHIWFLCPGVRNEVRVAGAQRTRLGVYWGLEKKAAVRFREWLPEARILICH